MPQERYEDVKTSTIALAGLIGAIVVFALILLLMVIYYQVNRQQTQIKQINEPPAEWSNLKTAQEGKLSSYRWVDPQRKIVAIPIDLAMRLVTAEVAASGRPKLVPRPSVIKKPAAPAAGTPRENKSGGKKSGEKKP
jgi:hypothetical protein